MSQMYIFAPRGFDSTIIEECMYVTINFFVSTLYYCVFLFRISDGYFMVRAYKHQEIFYNLLNEV